MRHRPVCLTSTMSSAGDPTESSTPPYLICLPHRPDSPLGVSPVWGAQGRQQGPCSAHCPGPSGCCSPDCLFWNAQRAAAWREEPVREWKGWTPSGILFPAEHLAGKRGGWLLQAWLCHGPGPAADPCLFHTLPSKEARA